MRLVLFLFLTTILIVMMVSGVVLNLAIIIIKVTGSIALTQGMCWALYGAATVIVVLLLWLFVKLGGGI